jgi:hypothetical protein
VTRFTFQQALAQHFNLDELRTLAFELGIEHDDIPAAVRGAYARELISYCERRPDYIRRLIELCKRERPEVDWSYTQLRQRKTPQAARRFLWPIIGVLSLVIVSIFLYLFVKGIGTFDYAISVSSADTEAGISGAKVTLELQDLPPKDDFTDANGYVVFSIPNALANSRALLIVQDKGHVLHRQQILIRRNELPRGVRLERTP